MADKAYAETIVSTVDTNYSLWCNLYIVPYIEFLFVLSFNSSTITVVFSFNIVYHGPWICGRTILY